MPLQQPLASSVPKKRKLGISSNTTGRILLALGPIFYVGQIFLQLSQNRNQWWQILLTLVFSVSGMVVLGHSKYKDSQSISSSIIYSLKWGVISFIGGCILYAICWVAFVVFVLSVLGHTA